MARLQTQHPPDGAPLVIETPPDTPSAPGQGGGKAKRPSTRKLQARFLDLFRRLGIVAPCARQAGIARDTVYQWLNRYPAFAAKFTDALESALDDAEAEVVRRGVVGWEEGVWHRGERVGSERRYSDGLLLALLKARRPRVWAPPMQAELTGMIGVSVEVVQTAISRLPAREKARLGELCRATALTPAEWRELQELRSRVGLAAKVSA